MSVESLQVLSVASTSIDVASVSTRAADNSRIYLRPPLGNSSQCLNFRSFWAREAIAVHAITRIVADTAATTTRQIFGEGTEHDTRGARATQTKTFRLAAETSRLAACAPQTTRQRGNAAAVVTSFCRRFFALLRQGYGAAGSNVKLRRSRHFILSNVF